MSTKPQPLRNLASNKSGAAMLEFLLAIVPVLSMFLMFSQLTLVYTAHMVVQHSAASAARAAAVITNDDANPGKHGTAEDITRAAKIAMGPWFVSQSLLLDNVGVTDGSSGGDVSGTVTVSVETHYQCVVPWANAFVCTDGDAFLHQKAIKATASFPHQGASYKMSDCDKEAQGPLGNSGGGSSIGAGGEESFAGPADDRGNAAPGPR